MKKVRFLRAILALVSLVGTSAMLEGQEGQSLADIARKVRAQKAAAAAQAAAPAEPKPAAPVPPISAKTPAPAALPDTAPVIRPVAVEPAVPVAPTAPVPQAVPEKAFEAAYDKTLDKTTDPDLYVARISALLEQEKFKDLDDHARVLRSQKLRFPGGGWKLYSLYLVITNTLAGDKAEDADYEENFQRLKRWIAARPESITPRVALAYAYDNWAWKARGTGTAGEVSDEGWRLFRERTQMAKSVLQEAAALQEKCPEWFHRMIALALAEGWEKKQAEMLLEQAVAFEPEYSYIYEQYANYLLPKWYGEEGEALRFAERIADRIGGKKGDVIYFRIAVELECRCTTETYLAKASWARIKRGYEALEEIYGLSNLRLNQICYIANKFGDFEYADKLFERIGDNWDIGTWQHKELFDRDRSNAYVMVNLKPAYQAAASNEKTEEGKDYKQKMAALLGTPQAGPFKECFTEPQDGKPNFEMVMKVARNSAMESLMFWPPFGPEGCIRTKIKAIDLPTPPADEYWVSVTMKIH
jgi:hypothetical protein